MGSVEEWEMKKLIQRFFPDIRYYPGYVINKPAINRRHELKEVLGGIVVMAAIYAIAFVMAII